MPEKISILGFWQCSLVPQVELMLQLLFLLLTLLFSGHSFLRSAERACSTQRGCRAAIMPLKQSGNRIRTLFGSPRGTPSHAVPPF